MAGAKYGYAAYKYGHTTRYYGVDGTNPGGEAQWIFLVDWDNDGSFNYNEASYMVDMEVNRGNRYLVQPGGNGFETIQPGDGSVTLENIGRRFDPDYAAGPLHDKILPGRKFRLMVKDLTTGTRYNVMAGIIYDIPPITETDRIILSLRESSFLLDKKISMQVIYRKSISDVMMTLLETAKFPGVFGKTIDTETQYITAFGMDNINALDTLIELGAACLGQVFTDASGKIKFYSRGHASMGSIAIGQADCLKTIRRSQPWENLRNIIQITANKKVKAREQPVWQNSGPMRLEAYETRVVTVKFDAAIESRVYRIKANSKVDGTGFNRSLGVNYTVKTFLGSLELTLINTHAYEVYITEIIILGHPIVEQPMMTTVKNALSTAKYPEMVFDMDNPWMQSHNHAKAFATMVSNFLDEPERTIEIVIEQLPALQYSFDLMDKIPFTAAALFGATQNMFVGRIEHRWSDATGQAVTTTLVMRPRLTDGTVVDNDPEDPDLPYIPDPPIPPDTPPPEIPPDIPPPGQTCLTDPDAPMNGPWGLALGVLDSFPVTLYSNEITTGGYNIAQVGTYTFKPLNNMWLRPGSFTNKSILEITGDWEVWNPGTGAWQGETSSTNWLVDINGVGGVKQAIVDNGHGTRALVFLPYRATKATNIYCAIDSTSDAVPLLDITPQMAVGTGTYFVGSDSFSTKDDMAYTETDGFAGIHVGDPRPCAGAIWSINIPLKLEDVTGWLYYIKLVDAVLVGGPQAYQVRPDEPDEILPTYAPYLNLFQNTEPTQFNVPPPPVLGSIQTVLGPVTDGAQTYDPGIHYFGISVRELATPHNRATFQILDIKYRIGGVYYSIKDIAQDYEPPHRWVIRNMVFKNICSK